MVLSYESESESESESYTSILRYQVLVISDCCISSLSQQTSPSCVGSSGLTSSINTPSTKLSRAWGEFPSLNGSQPGWQSLELTDNLFAALMAYSRPDPTRVLWVDATYIH